MPDAIEVKEEAREKSRVAQREQAKAKKAGIVLALGGAFVKWASMGEYGESAFRGLSIAPNGDDQTYRITLKVWSLSGEALVTFGQASTLVDALLLLPTLARGGRFMPDKFAGQRGAGAPQGYEVDLPPED